MFNLTSKYKINLQNHKFHKTLNHPKKQVSQISKVVNKPIQKIN